jgi:hypothetical protein
VPANDPSQVPPHGRFGRDAPRAVASSAEDSPRGLWRSLGKRVGFTPSRVRIPHPPPVEAVRDLRQRRPRFEALTGILAPVGVPRPVLIWQPRSARSSRQGAAEGDPPSYSRRPTSMRGAHAAYPSDSYCVAGTGAPVVHRRGLNYLRNAGLARPHQLATGYRRAPAVAGGPPESMDTCVAREDRHSLRNAEAVLHAVPQPTRCTSPFAVDVEVNGAGSWARFGYDPSKGR